MLMNNVIAKFNKICHYCGAELKGRSDKNFVMTIVEIITIIK